MIPKTPLHQEFLTRAFSPGVPLCSLPSPGGRGASPTAAAPLSTAQSSALRPAPSSLPRGWTQRRCCLHRHEARAASRGKRRGRVIYEGRLTSETRAVERLRVPSRCAGVRAWVSTRAGLRLSAGPPLRAAQCLLLWGFWADCWVQGYGSQAVCLFARLGGCSFPRSGRRLSPWGLCACFSVTVCACGSGFRRGNRCPLWCWKVDGAAVGVWAPGGRPLRGAFSPGLPSPQSESPCWSYTEKAGFRVAGQRSRSHEGVGQGWNPLGTLAPPRSECAAGKREPAPAAPGELLRVPRVRGGAGPRSVRACASAKGSRRHGLALKETAGSCVPPASLWEAQGRTCCVTFVSFPTRVPSCPRGGRQAAGCWGADVEKGCFPLVTGRRRRGPDHSFTVKHTQF